MTHSVPAMQDELLVEQRGARHALDMGLVNYVDSDADVGCTGCFIAGSTSRPPPSGAASTP